MSHGQLYTVPLFKGTKQVDFFLIFSQVNCFRIRFLRHIQSVSIMSAWAVKARKCR